ncbi:MAG: hydrolase [Bacteroidetes bacterium]|jgi:8-oxo-dGDP phosphatase|nr:hydrolase [Bacteroidota bacterium]
MEWKSFVLIEKEGKYLLIREATRKWRGKWFLPGGKAASHEIPELAAHREVREEAGCSVILKGIFYLNYRERIFRKRISVFYAAEINGEGKLKDFPDKHSLEAAWFTYEELRTLPSRRGLRDLVDAYRKGLMISLENFKISA